MVREAIAVPLEGGATTRVEMVEHMLAPHKQLAAGKNAFDKGAIQRQIDVTDKQIGWLVCEPYGLAAKEIGVVEEGGVQRAG